jgi:hypothetical protein
VTGEGNKAFVKHAWEEVANSKNIEGFGEYFTLPAMQHTATSWRRPVDSAVPIELFQPLKPHLSDPIVRWRDPFIGPVLSSQQPE